MQSARGMSRWTRATAIAALVSIIPTAILWLCFLVSMGGVEVRFPAGWCCSLGGFGGLICFVLFPILGVVLAVLSIVLAKHHRMPVLLYAVIAATASAVFIMLAVAATIKG